MFGFRTTGRFNGEWFKPLKFVLKVEVDSLAGDWYLLNFIDRMFASLIRNNVVTREEANKLQFWYQFGKQDIIDIVKDFERIRNFH